MSAVRTELLETHETLASLESTNQELVQDLQLARKAMADAQASTVKLRADLSGKITSLTDANAETTAALEKEQAIVAEHKRTVESLSGDKATTQAALDKEQQLSAELELDGAEADLSNLGNKVTSDVHVLRAS